MHVEGVRLSHPDRVLYPDQGLTKAELASYYQSVTDRILPHVANRPISLVRCPRGHQETCFYQRNFTEQLPAEVDAVRVEERDGEGARYILIRDLPGLIALVQIGVLEIHPWGSRADRLDQPDRMVFDLDPGPDVPWSWVIEAAQTTGEALEALGLKSYVKTSGGKGLHVLAPLTRRQTWEELKTFTKSLAENIAEKQPQRYVSTASREKRQGKIFIDYLRNDRSATTVAAYSTRAKLGAPVSTPLRWDELDGLPGSDAYNVSNLPRRLAQLETDPWEDYFEIRQSITRDMRKAASSAGQDGQNN